PKTSATPAATSSGTVKSPDPDINRLVTRGANDPPTFPPKFCNATSGERICGGATSIGIEFTAAVEKLTLATEQIRNVTAQNVSGVYAPAIVKTVAPSSPPTANPLRTDVTRRPAAISRSPAQPPSSTQSVPIRNGSIPTTPVVSVDMPRWRTR